MRSRRAPEKKDPMREAEAAYREAVPLVLTMAKHAGLSDSERQEIVQRVGVVLVEKAAEFDDSKGSRRMWAAGIARNILLDARRAAREERRRTEPSKAVKHLPTPTLTPEQALRARESLAFLREAVREENRPVFELDAVGCTAAEIGELLGLPTTTVEWRLREARKDLERALARMDEDKKTATRIRGLLLPLFAESAAGRPAAASHAAVVGRHLPIAAVAGLMMGSIAAIGGGPLSVPHAGSRAERAVPAIASPPDIPPATTVVPRRPCEDRQSLPREDRQSPPREVRKSPPPEARNGVPRKLGDPKWVPVRDLLGWRPDAEWDSAAIVGAARVAALQLAALVEAERRLDIRSGVGGDAQRAARATEHGQPP